MEVLGTDAGQYIPADYHPVRVSRAVPRFIVRAMEHQVAVMRSHDPRINPAVRDGRLASSSMDDYVGDVLFNEIQPVTVAALGHDSAFVQAYFYPLLD